MEKKVDWQDTPSFYMWIFATDWLFSDPICLQNTQPGICCHKHFFLRRQRYDFAIKPSRTMAPAHLTLAHHRVGHHPSGHCGGAGVSKLQP
jgi:hypothetical protein